MYATTFKLVPTNENFKKVFCNMHNFALGNVDIKVNVQA